MSKTKTIKFSADPMYVIRIALEIAIDKMSKAEEIDLFKERIMYRVLRDTDDDALEKHVDAWMLKNNYPPDRPIFQDPLGEAKDMWKVIMGTDQWASSRTQELRSGEYCKGVYDKGVGEFYVCDVGEHWFKIKEVLKEHYPDKYEIIRDYKYSKNKEYTEDMQAVDKFILENFELTGPYFNSEGYIMRVKER